MTSAVNTHVEYEVSGIRFRSEDKKLLFTINSWENKLQSQWENRTRGETDNVCFRFVEVKSGHLFHVDIQGDENLAEPWVHFLAANVDDLFNLLQIFATEGCKTKVALQTIYAEAHPYALTEVMQINRGHDGLGNQIFAFKCTNQKTYYIPNLYAPDCLESIPVWP